MIPPESRSRTARSPALGGRPAGARRAIPDRPSTSAPIRTPAVPATILAQRAAALALVPVQEEAVATLDVLEFLLAGETYGIAITYIGEIYPLRELTSLPCTPPFVRGITSVRGQIFSVIDLHRFFALDDGDGAGTGPGGHPAAGAPAIILQAGEMRVAVLVDRIVGVRTLPLAAIQPVPLTLTGAHTAYLHGVTSDRLLILDAGKLLTDGALIINDAFDY